MKTKNVALAVAAFTLAITGAIASSFVAEVIHIRGVMAIGEEYSCLNTGVSCSDTGTNVCQISIPLRSGGTAIASSTGNPRVYKAGCVDFITANSQDVLLQAPFTGNNRPISIE